jgi:hypothetical protein
MEILNQEGDEMKIYAKQLSIYILILMLSALFIGDLHQAQAFINPNKTNTITEGSTEELYQDIFVTMLLPYIDKEVEKYYGEPFLVAPYEVDVISINRPHGYRTFIFEITLQLMPYEGAHNSVGLDQITLEVSSRNVKVIEFKHLKSYDLPEYTR